jgi:hypothetical protein
MRASIQSTYAFSSLWLTCAFYTHQWVACWLTLTPSPAQTSQMCVVFPERHRDMACRYVLILVVQYVLYCILQHGQHITLMLGKGKIKFHLSSQFL